MILAICGHVFEHNTKRNGLYLLRKVEAIVYKNIIVKKCTNLDFSRGNYQKQDLWTNEVMHMKKWLNPTVFPVIN